MNDSRRYRSNAADCLLAAKDAQRPGDRQLRLSMANSWLLLARRDEALDKLLASGDTNEPIKADLVLGTASNPFVSRGPL
jgi:hypothetical protein